MGISITIDMYPNLVSALLGIASSLLVVIPVLWHMRIKQKSFEERLGTLEAKYLKKETTWENLNPRMQTIETSYNNLISNAPVLRHIEGSLKRIAEMLSGIELVGGQHSTAHLRMVSDLNKRIIEIDKRVHEMEKQGKDQ